MLDLNLTLVIQMGLFLVFAGLMNAIFFKPVTKVLAERRAYVAGKHAQAAQDLQAVAALQQDYDSRLKAARLESQEVIQQAVAEAEKKRQEQLAVIKGEVEKQIASARESIRAERETALASLTGDVDALAGLMAGKVAGGALGTQPVVGHRE